MINIDRYHSLECKSSVSLLGMNSAWNPALYDDRAAFVSELAADLVLWLRPRTGERILDLGCGTGTLTAQIARQGALVTGIDRSAEMIASAREKYAELAFEVGDGQNLRYSAEFDALFSNAALHWMPRATDVLHGVERALVPGGRFVAEFGGAGCVQTVTRAVADILREWAIDPAPYQSWFFPSPGRYAGLLEDCGLVVRELRYFERPTPVPGADGLSTWLAVFQTGLMNDLGDRWPVLCQMASQRCRSALFRDGQWWLDYVRLRVVATKP
jgi:trans-aconitate methyltransferase